MSLTTHIGYGQFQLQDFLPGEMFARFDSSLARVCDPQPTIAEHVLVWLDYVHAHMGVRADLQNALIEVWRLEALLRAAIARARCREFYIKHRDVLGTIWSNAMFEERLATKIGLFDEIESNSADRLLREMTDLRDSLAPPPKPAEPPAPPAPQPEAPTRSIEEMALETALQNEINSVRQSAKEPHIIEAEVEFIKGEYAKKLAEWKKVAS